MRVKRCIWAILFPLTLAVPSECASLELGKDEQATRTQLAQHNETDFQWVTQQQNPVEWSKVKAAFRQELRPDKRNSQGTAYGYKYILRIGAYKNSRLVLIGQRTKKNDPPEFDLFLAFTYDVRTSRKSRVMPSNGFWYWRLVALAQIDGSPVPDVVFTHDDCIECEAKQWLSSFTYIPRDRGWKLRTWPPNETNLLIGGASKDEPTEIYEYICLYTIHDFSGDGLKDIAIWCRERATIRGGTADTIVMYTAQDDMPRKVVPTGTLLASIKNELCTRTPRSPLCASAKY